MSEIDRERMEEMLRREDGATIPEIAEDLNEPREKVREALREFNAEHELGSSMDFRYKVIEPDD